MQPIYCTAMWQGRRCAGNHESETTFHSDGNGATWIDGHQYLEITVTPFLPHMKLDMARSVEEITEPDPDPYAWHPRVVNTSWER